MNRIVCAFIRLQRRSMAVTCRFRVGIISFKAVPQDTVLYFSAYCTHISTFQYICKKI